MAAAKVVWLGNNTADFLKANENAEPIRVGEEIALTQAQVKALEERGHRFAKPKSEEAQAAQAAAQPTPAIP
jgi:hypothetical protein